MGADTQNFLIFLAAFITTGLQNPKNLKICQYRLFFLCGFFCLFCFYKSWKKAFFQFLKSAWHVSRCVFPLKWTYFVQVIHLSLTLCFNPAASLINHPSCRRSEWFKAGCQDSLPSSGQRRCEEDHLYKRRRWCSPPGLLSRPEYTLPCSQRVCQERGRNHPRSLRAGWISNTLHLCHPPKTFRWWAAQNKNHRVVAQCKCKCNDDV